MNTLDSTLLEDKTALVTGGSRGIGAAIVKRFLSNGAKVLINCASESKALAELTLDLTEFEGRFSVSVGDVADEAFVKTMVTTAQNELGYVNILVNNAGITRDKPLSFMRAADWDTVVDTNLRGPFLCAKAVVKPMMRAGWGRIINLSSVSALSGRLGQSNYAAAKAGMIGFSKSLAREVASHNVLVNTICVGAIETRMTKKMPRDTFQELKDMIPLGRLGQPDEVAGACLFLGSELSSYVTGSTLNVSGGGYM